MQKKSETETESRLLTCIEPAHASGHHHRHTPGAESQPGCLHTWCGPCCVRGHRSLWLMINGYPWSNTSFLLYSRNWHLWVGEKGAAVSKHCLAMNGRGRGLPWGNIVCPAPQLGSMGCPLLTHHPKSSEDYFFKKASDGSLSKKTYRLPTS